mgnify:CR=1 FL=1
MPSFGPISRLPVSLRVVLESLARNVDGKRVTEQNVRALANWKPTAPRTEEIPFVVARIVLQDFTGVPAVVDLAAMRDAMARAEVGDDVYGEDPTVNRLQEEVAGLLGKEAGLFVPSGTMANQLALGALTRPGDEIICDAAAHCISFEGGALAALWGVQPRAIAAPRGILMLGVQGCGKSLTAKAIASQWRLPLLRLDMGAIFGSLMGSSEANIRRAIKMAEGVAPATLTAGDLMTRSLLAAEESATVHEAIERIRKPAPVVPDVNTS